MINYFEVNSENPVILHIQLKLSFNVSGRFIPRLHDRANIEQTSSWLVQLTYSQLVKPAWSCERGITDRQLKIYGGNICLRFMSFLLANSEFCAWLKNWPWKFVGWLQLIRRRTSDKLVWKSRLSERKSDGLLLKFSRHACACLCIMEFLVTLLSANFKTIKSANKKCGLPIQCPAWTFARSGKFGLRKTLISLSWNKWKRFYAKCPSLATSTREWVSNRLKQYYCNV